MLVDLDILFVLWMAAAVGQVDYMRLRWKWMRSGTVWPVRGLTIGTGQCPARLEDLHGPGGRSPRIVWARTPGGIVCRSPTDGTVVGYGRQRGDLVVVDAVMPWNLALAIGGLAAFLIAATLFVLRSAGWGEFLPILLTLGFGAAIGFRFTRSRTTARAFPGAIATLCTRQDD